MLQTLLGRVTGKQLEPPHILGNPNEPPRLGKRCWEPTEPRAWVHGAAPSQAGELGCTEHPVLCTEH